MSAGTQTPTAVTIINDAATALGKQALSDALIEIKAKSFTGLLESSAAIQ